MSNPQNNRYSQKLSAKEKELAEAVCKEIELEGFSIEYKNETSSLLFRKELRVVEVLGSLIEKQRWGDIRHLFRAVLAPGPQLFVYGAENDWSRGDF
jgi:hypothetical protein